jgi:hypothetical protein
MVEEQIIFGVANEVGDLAHERGVRYVDARNGFKRVHGHDYLLGLGPHWRSVAILCGTRPFARG